MEPFPQQATATLRANEIQRQMQDSMTWGSIFHFMVESREIELGMTPTPLPKRYGDGGLYVYLFDTPSIC